MPELKSQTPCVCAAQGCHPSQAGLHWFARWHSEETTLDVTSICHTDKTQASPVCSGCTSPSCGLHPSIRTQITSGLASTRPSGDAVGPSSGRKHAGGCQSNSCACNLPPAPHLKSPRKEQSRERAVSR